MKALLFIMLFPVCAAAQCGSIAWIHAPRVGDSLEISWSHVPQADFYYVYVRPYGSQNATIYIESRDSITVKAPSSYYAVNVVPNCQSIRLSCCDQRKNP